MLEVNIQELEVEEGKLMARFLQSSNQLWLRLLHSQMGSHLSDQTLFIGRLWEIILKFLNPKERERAQWATEKIHRMQSIQA